MFFSDITKRILIKNLVKFKRWDGVKNLKNCYYGHSLKIPNF